MATTSEKILRSADLTTTILKERRALLQRVLWSRHIEKSTRIRDFLAFVCERALEDPSVEIHEQEIGCRVFGRKGDYDTAADNIVRVTASQTRKKLERYFTSDGVSEPVILEIPKGRYTPVFRERNPVIEETSIVRTLSENESEVHAKPATHRRVEPILAICMSLLAVITVLAVWNASSFGDKRLAEASQSVPSELDSNPSLRALWLQLIPRTGRVDVVVTDSSLSLFGELVDHQITLAEYLKPDQWTAAGTLSSNPELQTFARHAAERQLTSVGSVTTAFRIAQLATTGQNHVSISSARDFNIHQMKSDNVILLGSTGANPWVELIEDRMNFRFRYDRKLRYLYFENINPRPGEPRIYRAAQGISYCHIAFLPNLSGTGNILSVSGTETEGTEGGGEFVTSERSLANLRSALGVDHADRMPYFEVLLESRRVGGATQGFSIVAFRLLKP